MNEQESTSSTTFQRPMTIANNPQSWRTLAEISPKRKKELDSYRALPPDIEKGSYPFNSSDINLTRADVEWLLAMHDNEEGPVDWSDEHQRKREGLDLRGADLRKVDLKGLPLARMRGGLSLEERLSASDELCDRAAAHLEEATLTGAHLEGADLSFAHLSSAYLEGADLRGAHLEKAYLRKAHLEGAILSSAHLKEAYLNSAHLEGADLSSAHLEGAILSAAHLEGTDLSAAYLEGADLSSAHLEGAILNSAHLEGAVLSSASLGGKPMPAEDLSRIQQWKEDFPATLPPADLREAFFDTTTILKGINLGDQKYGFVSMVDVRWGNVNLAVVNWEAVKRLGDEREARQQKQLDKYQAAVRAYRQLAVTLQAQGLNEEASDFSYRAQVLQRRVLWQQIDLWQKVLILVVWMLQKVRLWQKMLKFGAWVRETWAWKQLVQLWQKMLKFGDWVRETWAWKQLKRLWQIALKLGAYIFSWVLGLLAGYGYKPGRALRIYLLVIFVFAWLYFMFGHDVKPHPLTFLGALVLSLTSFHGRGFFPGENASPDDPLIVLAAVEAVVGLIIEISFIATFTQRFFGK